MYKDLTGELSVHMADYPVANKELLEPHIEERMDLVRDLVSLGRAAREKVRIKVRQPIAEVLIDGKYEELIKDLVPLFQEELNVKEVVFAKHLDEYMEFSLKPNFKVAGPIFGPKIKLLGKALAEVDGAEAVKKLEAGETLKLTVDGETLDVVKDHVLITITAKEGFTVGMENNLFVILETTLTQELLDEGYAREFISKVQQMRKNNGYEMLDRIKIFYDGDDEIANAVNIYEDYIKTETLADAIERVEDDSFEKQDLNGHNTGMKLEKV
jgi:isoleucyl-tRNA synthetase